MAKIKDIDYQLGGERKKTQVKCSSAGIFSVSLPSEVATALGLRAEITGGSLPEVETSFHKAIRKFREAKTTQDIFILIQFKARGLFFERADGTKLDSARNSPFYDDSSFAKVDNTMGFGFQVAIKENVAGNITWYKAGKNLSKGHQISDYKIADYRVIPFTPQALASLEAGQENLRKLSEFLFDFVSQDEKLLEQKLTVGLFLNQSNAQ